jgi:hypothetical protein
LTCTDAVSGKHNAGVAMTPAMRVIGTVFGLLINGEECIVFGLAEIRRLGMTSPNAAHYTKAISDQRDSHHDGSFQR